MNNWIYNLCQLIDVSINIYETPNVNWDIKYMLICNDIKLRIKNILALLNISDDFDENQFTGTEQIVRNYIQFLERKRSEIDKTL